MINRGVNIVNYDWYLRAVIRHVRVVNRYSRIALDIYPTRRLSNHADIQLICLNSLRDSRVLHLDQRECIIEVIDRESAVRDDD